jgi:hypothetical protein
MPSIGAGVVATMAGWVIDAMLQPFLGTGVTLVLSFVASTIVFVLVQRWLKNLRDG